MYLTFNNVSFLIFCGNTSSFATQRGDIYSHQSFGRALCGSCALGMVHYFLKRYNFEECYS